MDQGEWTEQFRLLTNRVVDLESKMMILFHERKKAVDNKRKKDLPAPSVPAWEAYRDAFLKRYKVFPVRNAKVNRQCLDLMKRIGEDATKVIEFYLTLNDPQFLRMNHPLGVLLLNCESIHTMWQRGKMTTSVEAQREAQRGTNMNAANSYLESKHGKNNPGS